MLRKLALSTFLIGLAASTSAEESYIAPLVKESMLLDVAQANATVVVGERGHILVGDNTSLQQVTVPSTVTLTAVDGVGDVFLAVGHDATILRSEDAGQTWQEVFSAVELDRPFLDVLFIDDSTAIAVGGYGLFYFSDDGGMNWELQQNTSLLSPDDVDYLESIADDPEFYQEELNYIFPHFNRLSVVEDKLYLAGEAGLIAVSNNRGATWERYDIDYYGSFFDIRELQNGDLLAVGLRGNMFLRESSSDWRRLETCVTTSLNSIIQANNGHYVLGNNGVVLKVDISALDSEMLGSPNNEGCQRHAALSKIESTISSTISNAFMLDGKLTAVSANGLQPVE